MNRTIVLLAALAIIQACLLLTLVLSSQQMPPRVASHFNGAGVPDGWMSRSAYLATMAAIGIGLPLFQVGLFYSIRYFPCSVINVPRRDYWLAPERQPETFDAIFRFGIWLAILVALYVLAIHLLVVAANRSQPVQLSSYVWWLLASFLVAIMVWTFALIQQFRRA
jgi:serine/threonine-protein kinase